MIVALGSAFIIQHSSFVFAAQSADDVLKNISDNVNDSVDPKKLLAFVFCAAAVIIAVALLSKREKKSVVNPKTLNHQGKLIKEIAKSVNLKPVEVKQLKVLAEQAEISSPLLLLLCPSLLTQAVKDHPNKINRQTILSVARKITAK